MANTRDRITDTAENVRPYVERAVKDEEVRENVKSALMAARNIYDELIGSRGVTYAATRMATDKDLQESLRAAIEDLRKAADRVQGKDTHTTRNVTLLVTGIALGLLFNPVTGPSTRRWLSDLVLGKDEFGDTAASSGNSNPAATSPSAT
jgi:prophage DNA circulation protein